MEIIVRYAHYREYRNHDGRYRSVYWLGDWRA